MSNMLEEPSSEGVTFELLVADMSAEADCVEEWLGDEVLPGETAKVEPDAAGLCPTCLSRGRRALPLHDEAGTARAYSMLLAGFLEEEHIEDFVRTALVCWECHRFMSRMLSFQNQVLDASVLLQSYGQFEDGEANATSLSNLASSTVVGCNYEITHEYPVKKTESEEESSQIEPQVAQVVKRARGRPRKNSLPFGRQSPQPKRRYTKRNGKPAAGKSTVKGGKRDPRFVSVRVGEAELEALRATERARDEYASALYKCESCIKGFSYVSLLEKHERSKHSEEAGEHPCPVCELRFQDAPTMERHRRRHYLLYSCGECGYTGAHLGDVEKHYSALHDPGRTYPCNRCGQLFTQERKMRYHKETTHKESYQCEYCNKIFKNLQTYKAHLQIHTGMPTLECSVCQKRCRGEGGLYAHMRTAHKLENPEEAFCVECQVQFRNRDGYRFHLRHSVKHATPARLKYQCQKCSKRFLSESALKQHDQYYHLEYVCTICNKKLNSRYTFSKHMKFVHEGYVLPRKHICDACGKGFKTKVQLNTHLLTHTGERPHACDVCGATFAQVSTLRTHKRLIHLKTTAASHKMAAG